MKFPSNIKNIYLIAICGTAMGAIAAMLKDLGYIVKGSDQKIYPPISSFLEEKKIQIFNGFSEDNLNETPDVVIIGNAVSKENVEVQKVQKSGLFFCSMPQAINHFFAENKKTIVATGTHGKTTTSSAIAWVLESAGFDPSFVIGGILKNFNSNSKLGGGHFLVLEGDEYDTAFFDKKSKFMHYAPEIAIISNIEFDHADIFQNIDEIKASFEAFVKKMVASSTLIVFDDDKNIDAVIQNAKCKIQRYGKKESSAWCVKNIKTKDAFSYFSVFHKGVLFDDYKTQMTGEHNMLNLLSVIAAASITGLPKEKIKKGIETFCGIKRRQEVRGVKNGIVVIDDFAHHPTAVKKTIEGIKKAYPTGKCFAVFEPRTNSSMRKIFQKEYALSFDCADFVCLSEPDKINKIPLEDRFSIKELTQDLKDKGKNAVSFSDTDELIEFLAKNLKRNDVALIMSNGAFDNIHNRLLDKL